MFVSASALTADLGQRALLVGHYDDHVPLVRLERGPLIGAHGEPQAAPGQDLENYGERFPAA